MKKRRAYTDISAPGSDRRMSAKRYAIRFLPAFLRRHALTGLLLLSVTFSALAGVREVGAIGLTVNDLDRELNFYTSTLPFELVSVSHESGKELDDLLGLRGASLRVATLKLGDETIALTEHLGRKGRPIPRDSRSFDRWFQHIAIVVSDMDKAYARLLER
jgi:catechol 2,3-dioxygenase-like lactoylglutathione lyase family enzyme